MSHPKKQLFVFLYLEDFKKGDESCVGSVHRCPRLRSPPLLRFIEYKFRLAECADVWLHTSTIHRLPDGQDGAWGAEISMVASSCKSRGSGRGLVPTEGQGPQRHLQVQGCDREPGGEPECLHYPHFERTCSNAKPISRPWAWAACTRSFKGPRFAHD